MAFHTPCRNTSHIHIGVGDYLSACAQLLPFAPATVQRQSRQRSRGIGRRQGSSAGGRHSRTNISHCRCIQLSVFMSVLNVHANWFPVDGEVLYVKHHSGRFLSAWLPKSSTENERSTVAIRSDAGPIVLMRQVAGALARRIVTYACPGERASIEQHMGFIKFGSRIDLYLPLDSGNPRQARRQDYRRRDRSSPSEIVSLPTQRPQPRHSLPNRCD